MKIYRREECVRQETGPCGFVMQVCNLCDGSSLEADDLIDHEPDCLFACPDVLAFIGVTMTTPRSDICGDCPAMLCFSYWRGRTHEDLLLMCAVYAEQDKLTDRMTREEV